jgi:hypothetical protein
VSASKKRWRISGNISHDASREVSVTVDANGKGKALDLAYKKFKKQYPDKTIVIKTIEQLSDEED